MNRKAIAGATAALVAGTVMLVPGSARASIANLGPTTVCGNFAGVSGTVAGFGNTSAMFAYNGVFTLNGEFNQSGAGGPIDGYATAWIIQNSTSANYIMIGAHNNQSTAWNMTGFIVEQWICT
jgi:hypothetical protein